MFVTQARESYCCCFPALTDELILYQLKHGAMGKGHLYWSFQEVSYSTGIFRLPLGFLGLHEVKMFRMTLKEVKR